MTRTKSAARKLVTQQDRIDSLNESLSSARQDAARARDEQRQAERDQKRAERELANAEMRLRRARRDEAEALARQQDHLSDLEDEQRVIERFTGQPEDMLTFVEQAARRADPRRPRRAGRGRDPRRGGPRPERHREHGDVRGAGDGPAAARLSTSTLPLTSSRFP